MVVTEPSQVPRLCRTLSSHPALHRHVRTVRTFISASFGKLTTIKACYGQGGYLMQAGTIQLPSLTGLRFFAALAVVLYHMRLYFAPIGDGLVVFSYGFTGVSFFFILSGFVLTWSHQEGARPGKFYWNRFARIWPLHVLTMVLAIFAPPLPASSGTAWGAAPFVLTLTQAWIPGSPYLTAFNGVSWSLSCEAFFYLLFPALSRRIGASGRLRRLFVLVPVTLLALAAGLSAAASTSAADYILGPMPIYRLGEFVLGMCLAKTMTRGWRPRFNLLHASVLLILLTAGLFVASIVSNGMARPFPVLFANLVMIPGFLMLIAAAAASDISGRMTLLTSRSLVQLGEWSYALYLVHELVIRVGRPIVLNTSVVGGIGLASLAVVVSILLSGVLHEFGEKPAEKWLRRRYLLRPDPQRVQHP
ncbi:acyltransferase family protein [Arthrobacter sp. 8AJ]|uniref:acyltransferase family protein n=1 Tax=Arthrobacter sp. 8AJ TaxID=2653130 RepID=UPI002E2D222B|nr:acyltransferase [Arthrobacter sp. 8AJ]